MKKVNFNLSLDKLEITYRAEKQVRDALASINETGVFDEIRLLRIESNSYKHNFVLLAKDFKEGRGAFERKIGYLYFETHNPNRPHIYISFDNEALYDEYLLASRFYVEEALGLDFFRVSKIDIALDTNINLVRRFYALCRDENYSLTIFNKRCKGMNEIVKELLSLSTGPRKNPFKNRSFVIGEEGKPLSLRCYNKTLELEKSRKDYIPVISGKQPMYRLEVSLGNHKNIAKTLELLGVVYEDEVYSKLQSEDFLFELFRVTLDRIIRVGKGRKVFNLLQVLLN